VPRRKLQENRGFDTQSERYCDLIARPFAEQRGDTLVIVTADHECSGAALIGGSRASDAKLVELARANANANAARGAG
jgi:alkaline phosphatase